ncbi:hypothetical protein [Pectobacterium aroidearum]|uniref:hypothetical protein n=1 Tax=Pectobacterium aroidearum TaxID=1201031 RepID=UPI001CD34684|nr:hypothetical protein [Pectobacterium aroidearum]
MVISAEKLNADFIVAGFFLMLLHPLCRRFAFSSLQAIKNVQMLGNLFQPLGIEDRAALSIFYETP